MSPKKGLFQWEIICPTIDFQGTFVSFPGRIPFKYLQMVSTFNVQNPETGRIPLKKPGCLAQRVSTVDVRSDLTLAMPRWGANIRT